MEDPPAAFGREPSELSDDLAGADDEAFSAWLMALPPCPGIPSTPDAIAASVASARADIAAGRVYPHAVVSQWLKTWGTSDPRTFEEWLNDRNG